MRPSLVDWIVTRAGQIPEASAAFRSLTGSGFFSDAHAREHDPSCTIQNPSTARTPKRCSALKGEAFSHPGPYRRQPTPGTRLARGRRAWAAQRRLVPVGRCHRRADTTQHLEAGARLGSASTQPRKPRPPGPPRCSAPRPGASSPEPRGRGSAAGGGGPSSAAGAAGQAVPVPQHCWAAESACRRLAAPAAQATWSASAQWGPGEGASRDVGSDPPPGSRRDPRRPPTARCPGCAV